jgi:hypothetical protein
LEFRHPLGSVLRRAAYEGVVRLAFFEQLFDCFNLRREPREHHRLFALAIAFVEYVLQIVKFYIDRFNSPEKLAAFAGIDPSVKQSGEFIGIKVRMSKRGSPYLRRALFLASVACNLHNSALHAPYEKTFQGKRHYIALSAIARKLVNIIFKIMKSGEPYVMVMPDWRLVFLCTFTPSFPPQPLDFL